MPFLSSILSAQARGSRSSALVPLFRFLVAFGVLTVGLVATKSPTWLVALFAALIVLGAVGFLVSFGYLLLKDRDSLRSEKFVLNKMQIERSQLGDDRVGLHDDDLAAIDPVNDIPVLGTKDSEA